MDSREPVLGMTLEGSHPDPRLAGRAAIKITSLGDGTYYAGIDLDSPECDRVLGLFEQERRIPLRSHFNVYYSPDWWKDRDDRWVAALPCGDDYVHVSPANTFDPVCPRPCLGLVPPHLPFQALGRPRAHVVHAKFEEIFSRDMAAFLAALAPCQFGDVMLNNEILQSHRRLFPQLSRKVLAIDAMRNVKGGCALCGSRLLAGPGMALGRRVDDLVICRNEEGVGHLAAEHPIIASVEVAQQMKKRFPRGFALQPILDINSPCGQRIFQLFRRLQGLEALRAAEGDFEVQE